MATAIPPPWTALGVRGSRAGLQNKLSSWYKAMGLRCSTQQVTPVLSPGVPHKSHSTASCLSNVVFLLKSLHILQHRDTCSL